MTGTSFIGKTGWILTVILVFSLTYTVSAESGHNPVIIVVKDTRTKEYLEGARVYFDGGYQGNTTSSYKTGSVEVHEVSPGTHTVRVTRPGYNEITRKFVFPDETTVEVMISKGSLISLNKDGPTPHAINIVFYPSSTSYNCTDREKVPSPEYMSNETLFREDVLNIINDTYMNLDQVTSPADSLPDDYRNDFNFYYYYDPSSPADAFSFCSGSLPKNYWNNVTFSDVTVILYPAYYGRYANISCQPMGCTKILGPGRSQMKVPADQEMMVTHETGHAAFGLVDTYCGDTYYWQNDPYPNVWASLESCRADAQSHKRDPEQCRRIESGSSFSRYCIRNFWHWDPVPDIMTSMYGGFGDAATQRIRFVLSQAGTGVTSQPGAG